jgi:hypothetical protein
VTLPSDELEVAPQIGRVWAVVKDTKPGLHKIDTLWQTRRGADARLDELCEDWFAIEMPVNELADDQDPCEPEKDQGRSLWEPTPGQSPREVAEKVFAEGLKKVKGKLIKCACLVPDIINAFGGGTFADSTCAVCGGSGYVIELEVD